MNEPGDRELLLSLDSALGDAAARAGSRLACRPGCASCCIGPFPVTALDARRLREGLRGLGASDPARASAVARRARAAVRVLRRGFPGDAGSGTLGADDGAIEAFLDRHASAPCPALDPGTRRCDLYEHRPVSCRTFGLPALVGTERLPPCDLCFVGAAPGDVEPCRAEIDREGLEGRVLASLGPEGERETLVAFALDAAALGPPAGRRRG